MSLEPFQLSRVRQDLLDIPKRHFLTLPDNEAIYLANRFGIMAASQLPLLAILNSNVALSPRCFWWPRAQPRQCHTFFRGTVSFMYTAHFLITMTRFNAERLSAMTGIPSCYVRVVCLIMVILILSYRSKDRVLGRLGLAIRALGLILVVYHAPALRVYVWEALLIYGIVAASTTEIRITRHALFVATPSTATGQTTKVDDGFAEQYVWLKRYNGLSAFKSASTQPNDGDDTVLETTNMLTWEIRARSLAVAIARAYAAMLKVLRIATPRSPISKNQDDVLVAQFASKREASSEARLSILFEGRRLIMTRLLDEVGKFNPDRVLLVGGGTSGYLVYPLYFDLCRRKPSVATQIVWATVTKRHEWTAPHCVLALHSTRTTQNQSSLHGVLSSTGTNMKEIATGMVEQTRGEAVMVVVLGPEYVAKETRRYFRPFAMRGHKISLLHHDFKQTRA